MPEPLTSPEYSLSPSTTPTSKQKVSILTPSQKQELSHILEYLGNPRRGEELVLALNSISGAVSGLPYLSDYPAEIRSRLLERTKALLQDKQPLAAIGALGLKRLGMSRYRITRMATYSAFFHALIDVSLHYVAGEIAKLKPEETLPPRPQILPSPAQAKEQVVPAEYKPAGYRSSDDEQSDFRQAFIRNEPPKRRPGRPRKNRDKPEVALVHVLDRQGSSAQGEEVKPRVVYEEKREPLDLGPLSGEIKTMEEIEAEEKE